MGCHSGTKYKVIVGHMAIANVEIGKGINFVFFSPCKLLRVPISKEMLWLKLGIEVVFVGSCACVVAVASNKAVAKKNLEVFLAFYY